MYKSLLSLALMVSNIAPCAANGKERMQSQSSGFALHQISTSASALRAKKGKRMNLTAQDSGRSLNVALHVTLIIELAENPTTGYRWQVLENGAPVLRLSNDLFRRGSSAAVGAGGTRVLEFSTESAGAASLRIGYARPSDPASLKNEFLLHVQVTP
ncbi:MAG TPA: protease inhibitor I42 family protein [Candidatus Angelobacter sp.]|jgi:inhibitor of cysteine peptidase